MDRNSYLSIRDRPDFLYLYFRDCGGMHINQQIFNTLLSKWLQHMGMHPQRGRQIIVHFLDKKFG
jgi:hypothetical protein